MLLEELETRIQEAADARYSEFLHAFLKRVEELRAPFATLESQRKFLAFWRREKFSSLPRLEKRAVESGSEASQAAVERYRNWLEKVGFYRDGSGGPRRLEQMTEEQLQNLSRQMLVIFAELRTQKSIEDLRSNRGWRCYSIFGQG